jgi:hypothetical protein
MLTLTDSALAHIKSRQQPIFLEMPIIVQGDITFRESPSVRWGVPRDLQHYQCQQIQGVEVYVPHELPKLQLKIALSRFFWIKWLVVEGWALA